MAKQVSGKEDKLLLKDVQAAVDDWYWESPAWIWFHAGWHCEGTVFLLALPALQVSCGFNSSFYAQFSPSGLNNHVKGFLTAYCRANSLHQMINPILTFRFWKFLWPIYFNT
ncbi:MAG: hypothetical protein KGI54_13960 [Pseudomonadota bacterium]|nr:hypothetical protein [Pseudomonadota bacterium]